MELSIRHEGKVIVIPPEDYVVEGASITLKKSLEDYKSTPRGEE